jgi:hypothetical protein
MMEGYTGEIYTRRKGRDVEGVEVRRQQVLLKGARKDWGVRMDREGYVWIE